MPADARREFALEVVRRLRAAGFEALWAGGCVRDLLLGQESSDFDVATSAPPEAVIGLFRRTIPVGVSFGVVRVRGNGAAGEVEVATFRSDGAYVDGRRPETVEFGNARLDAERRDFTVNGMFLDPTSGTVIDYVGGRADLDARLLRAIGEPASRFTEDKLRLVRAVRFAARFGFAIEPETWSALVAMAPAVTVVAVERIADELRKILVHPTRTRALSLAMESGLLAAILPDIAALRGKNPAADRWDHTLRVLDLLPANPSTPLAYAALVHEAGGRALADRIGRDLKLANHDRERVAWLVEHCRALARPEQLRPAPLKRLLAAPGIADLLALHRAIALATTGDDGNVAYCESYLRDQPDGPINPPPLLTGNDLQQHGLPPGPRYKPILTQLYDAQLENTITTRDEALAWVDRELAADALPGNQSIQT